MSQIPRECFATVLQTPFRGVLLGAIPRAIRSPSLSVNLPISFALCAAGLFALLLMGRPASAQPISATPYQETPAGIETDIDNAKNPDSQEQSKNQAKPLDVVLVLDNSGSMKQNDPQRLMHKVVSDFAGQLSNIARLGIVVFDGTTRFMLDLTPVNTPEFASSVDRALAGLTYDGKLTDISIAVERTLYALREGKRAGTERVLVLLTDGIIDVGEPEFNREQSKWLRGNLALEAKQHSVRIFGVAFTEDADYQLIQSLSQTTDGSYFRVLRAEQIPGLFDKILQAIVDLTRVEPKQSPEPAPVQPKPSTETPKFEPVVVEVSPQYYEVWLGIGSALVLIAIILVTILIRSRSEKIPFAQMIRLDGSVDRKPYVIKDRITRIGRDRDVNDLVIAEDTISAQHAVVEYRNNIFYIRDLKSGNGTSLNSYPFSSTIEERELPLKNRDRIGFDIYEYQFQLNKKVDELINKPSKRPEVGRTVLREPVYYPTEEPSFPPIPSPQLDSFTAADREDESDGDRGQSEIPSSAEPAPLSGTWRSLPPPPGEAPSPNEAGEQYISDPAPPGPYKSKRPTKSDRSRPDNSTVRGIAPPHRASNKSVQD